MFLTPREIYDRAIIKIADYVLYDLDILIDIEIEKNQWTWEMANEWCTYNIPNTPPYPCWTITTPSH